jgi:hypothetical protein
LALNPKQESLLIAFAVMLVLCFVFNLKGFFTASGNAVSASGSLDFPALLSEWAVIALVFAVFMFLFRTKKKKGSGPN